MLVVDLFSGAGGLHLGFQEAGYDIGLCIDNNLNAEKTHRHNFPDIPFLNADIKELSSERIREMVGHKQVDIIIGGPPCQGFSTIGNRVSSNPERRMKTDPRNGLINEYIRILGDLKPMIFVMENVKGLLTMNNGRDVENAMEKFRELGYKATLHKVNMADYGVPQIRERVIIIGSKYDFEIGFPVAKYSEAGENGKFPWNPCWDVISDLVAIKEDASINHVPLKHTEKIMERYKLIPQGGRLPEDKLSPELYRKNFGNTYKRLAPNKPALTMVPGNDAFPIHPTLHRSLTVREAARIQTFPDWMTFMGNRRQQGHQVGNAVPPSFSKILAEHIKAKIKENTASNEGGRPFVYSN